MSKAEELKKVAAEGDVGMICDEIEAYAKGKNDVAKEDIADAILSAYKYAASIGIRQDDDKEGEAEDRAAILKDLDECPKKVLQVVESLGMDIFDEERFRMAEEERKKMANEA